MVSLTTFTGTVRLLQVGISVVMLGLSSKLTSDDSSLSSLTSAINDLVEDSEVDTSTTTTTSSAYTESSLSSLTNKLKPEYLSIATSSFTTVSHGILGVVAPNLLGSGTTGLFSNPRLITSFSTSLATLAETAYVTFVSASEVSALALWFASFTYQTSEYGNWVCNDVTSLMDQYNISETTTSEDISSILGVDTSTLSTNLTDMLGGSSNSSFADYFELFETLANLTSQEVSITNWNESSAEQKLQLLVALSVDCSLKKANIAVSFLGFFSFLVSGVTVGTSIVSLYIGANNFKKDDEEQAESDAIISKDGTCAYKILSTNAFLELLEDMQTLRSEDDTSKNKTTTADDGILTVESEIPVPNGKLTTVTRLFDFTEELNLRKRLGFETLDSNKLGRLKFSHAILFPQVNRNIEAQQATCYPSGY